MPYNREKRRIWENWPFKFIVWKSFNNVVGGLSGAIDMEEFSIRIGG